MSSQPPRPTRHQMFADFACIVATRSVCQRRIHVGCVITNMEGTKVEAIGYNGPARSLSHDCGGDPETPGQCSCVHAEVNAVLKATYGPDLRMYTTLSPCETCARMILNSTVREVVYLSPYRSLEGLRILLLGGVEVFSISSVGDLVPFQWHMLGGDDA